MRQKFVICYYYCGNVEKMFSVCLVMFIGKGQKSNGQKYLLFNFNWAWKLSFRTLDLFAVYSLSFTFSVLHIEYSYTSQFRPFIQLFPFNACILQYTACRILILYNDNIDDLHTCFIYHVRSVYQTFCIVV